MSDMGWFADLAPDDEEVVRGMWQPCIASRTGIHASLDIWFRTEQECEAFIRDEILRIGFYPGEEPRPEWVRLAREDWTS